MSEAIEDMSKLEIASTLFMATFKEHAGDDNLLDKKEFTKLIKSEMCKMCDKGQKENPEKMKEFFEKMDMDGDNHIDFNEFMVCMAGFTCLCYGMACQMEQQCKK